MGVVKQVVQKIDKPILDMTPNVEGCYVIENIRDIKKRKWLGFIKMTRSIKYKVYQANV